MYNESNFNLVLNRRNTRIYSYGDGKYCRNERVLLLPSVLIKIVKGLANSGEILDNRYINTCTCAEYDCRTRVVVIRTRFSGIHNNNVDCEDETWESAQGCYSRRRAS